MTLQLFLLLLLVGVAEANEIDEYLWIDHNNGMVATCNDTLTKCWTECELKMKEAMRLIRPYIDYGEVGTTTDLLYRSPQTRLREEADRLDKRDAALRKWDAIYQECVR
jgi:hypothetical protein